MAQHFVDMDMHKHNPSILSTDAINACVGICTFYNDGVFLLHASTAFGIPATLTTTKEDVQRVNSFLLINLLLHYHHFFL